jgi:hypothetical protein
MNGTTNPKPEKPDSEQFARVVLWHLCTINAALSRLEADFIRESMPGASARDILIETARRGQKNRKAAEAFYLDALEQANIKPSPTFPRGQKS